MVLCLMSFGSKYSEEREREREREREVLCLEKLNDILLVDYTILMCCNVKIEYFM